MAESEAKLARSLSKRQDHDGKRDEFEAWLAKKEAELEEASEMQPDEAAKENACHKCKVSIEYTCRSLIFIFFEILI